MLYPSNPQADLHVHTVASGHAYSTIGEIAQEAARKGVRMVGMTDHGPGLPGGPHPYHFAALRFVPEYLYGVRVLRGIEANILGIGQLDLDDGLLERLDLVMAGFHEECGFDERGRDENTRALLALMEKPKVKVIAHPGNPNFPLDYRAVVEKSLATGTALEINNSSFCISRRGSAGNCREIIRLCAELGAPVTLGSDAHIAQGVGEFDDALLEVAAAGIRWEQVVNRTFESALAFLGLSG
ncbi:PHP domain-containing protein [Trichloromonas sp.]|uniref:PHP domain-containing protein n=1 Tax=Trichloromonas sp. TaxID=3069249 RepID=UPI003D814E64